MVLVGIGISLLLDSIMPFQNPNYNRFYGMLMSIIITITVWEGVLRIDSWMNIKYPWQSKSMKRVLIQSPVSILYSALVIYFMMLVFNRIICKLPSQNQGTLLSVCIVVGLLVTSILLAIEISMQFFYNWKNSLLEIEKHKTETAQAQLQNLKNQINPHFLFNNLSVLSSLVYKDQDKAVDFINQLSKVYRYLLDNRNSELVTLENEMTFIHSYTYLLKIRFDKNILFNIDIEPTMQQRLIPPMSLQMLIENAIKHNEISNELPLTISISAAKEVLSISNNLQLRSNAEPSSKTGLQNIIDRYQYFTTNEVKVINDEKTFNVTLPLLHP